MPRKCIYWTCFSNSKPIYFIHLPYEKDSWRTQQGKKFLLLASSTKSQDRWDCVTFQLYPKTLLSLSPACMHVPTSVTLGMAGEFATVRVLSLVLCWMLLCAPAMLTTRRIWERFYKGLWSYCRVVSHNIEGKNSPCSTTRKTLVGTISQVIYRKIAVELSSLNIIS